MLSEEHKKLLETLRERFQNHLNRHNDMQWSQIEEKLKNNPDKMEIINQMERSGGEPDVIEYSVINDEYMFCDCSKETPIGRRSLCYDKQALVGRKTNKPQNSAIELAKEMKIKILNEEEYKKLQKLEEFDTKTSSWIQTPEEIRKEGGALFCDRRYKHVFVYHNSAESYYASRGFRGTLRV